MPRACREVLDATDPLSWNSEPNSSLSCLLSFLLLLEKKDLPPEDWRALLSDPDMVSSKWSTLEGFLGPLFISRGVVTRRALFV